MSEDILTRGLDLANTLNHKAEWKDEGKVVGDLVAEINRLRECCEKYGKKVMRQEASMLKVIGRNRGQRKQLAAKDIELAKWQDIAIEERCKAIMLMEKLKDVANNPDWQTRGLSLTHDEYMQQAAKELGIQISQDAAYVARLEKEFLASETAFWQSVGEVKEASAKAREALEKIRHADSI
jgi:type III secretion system FlhB-like substrate exporter